MLPATAVGTIEFRSLLEPVRVANPFVDYFEAACDRVDLEGKVGAARRAGRHGEAGCSSCCTSKVDLLWRTAALCTAQAVHMLISTAAQLVWMALHPEQPPRLPTPSTQVVYCTSKNCYEDGFRPEFQIPCGCCLLPNVAAARGCSSRCRGG